jgi:hypothetical protein
MMAYGDSKPQRYRDDRSPEEKRADRRDQKRRLREWCKKSEQRRLEENR